MPGIDVDVLQLTQRSSPTSAPPSGEYGFQPTSFGWIQQSPAGVEEQVSPVNAKAMVGGRLTLTSGTPVTTADVTAATTLYYTPYIGNQIALYDSTFTCWRAYTFTERSLSLSGLAASTPRDIFIYDNAGTLTLESVAWTNDTTRATALAQQDNIYVQSGAVHKRYLGTIRTTSTIGQCEDSGATNSKRFVWNYYNRVLRFGKDGSVNDHTYSTGAYRAWNNSAGTIRCEFIIGVVENAIMLSGGGRMDSGGILNIGLNSTTSPEFSTAQASNNNASFIDSGEAFETIPALGYSFVELLEFGGATPAHFVQGYLSLGVFA